MLLNVIMTFSKLISFSEISLIKYDCLMTTSLQPGLVTYVITSYSINTIITRHDTITLQLEHDTINKYVKNLNPSMTWLINVYYDTTRVTSLINMFFIQRWSIWHDYSILTWLLKFNMIMHKISLISTCKHV